MYIFKHIFKSQCCDLARWKTQMIKKSRTSEYLVAYPNEVTVVWCQVVEVACTGGGPVGVAGVAENQVGNFNCRTKKNHHDFYGKNSNYVLPV